MTVDWWPTHWFYSCQLPWRCHEYPLRSRLEKNNRSVIERFSTESRYLFWFLSYICFTSLCDWRPASRRSPKTKTNHDLSMRIFPPSAPATCIHVTTSNNDWFLKRLVLFSIGRVSSLVFVETSNQCKSNFLVNNRSIPKWNQNILVFAKVRQIVRYSLRNPNRRQFLNLAFIVGSMENPATHLLTIEMLINDSDSRVSNKNTERGCRRLFTALLTYN